MNETRSECISETKEKRRKLQRRASTRGSTESTRCNGGKDRNGLDSFDPTPILPSSNYRYTRYRPQTSLSPNANSSGHIIDQLLFPFQPLRSPEILSPTCAQRTHHAF